MKRLITFFFVALPLLLACDKPATQKIVITPPEKPTGQQGGNSGNNGGNGNATPTPPTPPENPNAILVTNSYVQKYLEEVNYPETNNPDTDAEYSFTRITDYPGGGPGEADIPPTHTISWTSDASAGSIKLHVWEGSWKGLGGKTLAFRKLYRGGAIHGSRLNAVGKAEFRAQGIKAEVDLREASSVPSKSPMGDDIAFFAPGFDSGYNHMVRDNQPKVKETFCFVVKCLRENKPVYFHCSAGRDRTGTLAVLLEGALGVSESDMAKDYELTYFSPEGWSMSTDEDGV